MRVRAKQMGYYDLKRRREGDVFDLVPKKGHQRDKDGKLNPVNLSPEEQFSSAWMERLEGAPKSKGKGKYVEVQEADENSTGDLDVI